MEKTKVIREVIHFPPTKSERSQEEQERAEQQEREEEQHEPEEQAEPWERQLKRNKSGEPKATLWNCVIALRNGRDWQGRIKMNEFARHVEFHNAGDPPEVWIDRHDLVACAWLNTKDIHVAPGLAHNAVNLVAVAKNNGYHPVLDYVNGLVWDGVPRLDRWLETYFKAEGPQLVLQAIGPRWLIGAMARILKPGSKVDYVLVAEGKQGARKSTSVRVLFEPWFSDDYESMQGKDAKMLLRGVWCLELGEITALRNGQVGQIKAFVTRQVDRYRDPYGKRVQAHPRTCCFFGTTNDQTYLNDPTGNRRFWPFKMNGTADFAALERDRDQLWAEAKARYQAGERYWIDDIQEPELAALLWAEQEARREIDPLEEAIAAHLEDATETSVAEILRDLAGKSLASITQKDANRVAKILGDQGWEKFRSNRSVGGHKRREWRYHRRQSEGA